MFGLIQNDKNLGGLHDPERQGDEVKTGKCGWLTRRGGNVLLTAGFRKHGHFAGLEIDENVHKIARECAQVVTRNCQGDFSLIAEETLNLAWLGRLDLPDAGKIRVPIRTPRCRCEEIRFAIPGPGNSRRSMVYPLCLDGS